MICVAECRLESRMQRLAQLLGPAVQQAAAALVIDVKLFCFPLAPQQPPTEDLPAEPSIPADAGSHEEDQPGCGRLCMHVALESWAVHVEHACKQ